MLNGLPRLTICYSYASSKEIKSYLKAVSFHYNIDKNISFNSKVSGAKWDEDRAVWTVAIADKGTFECDILFNAGGILNNISQPKIKNLRSFKGPVLHTANWDENISLTGRRVAMIGAGASAFQCLPAILPSVDHVDIYIRTPSWISPPAGGLLHEGRNHTYTAKEKARFDKDPKYSAETRKEIETIFNSQFKAFIRDSNEQHLVKAQIEKYMRDWIPSPEMQEKLIPSFEVGCRRISPGEAYLEALQSPKVNAVFDAIDEVTEDGVTALGVHRPADLLVTATGFDTSFRPRFPILGQDANLVDLWKDIPISYFGVAVAGFPNYLTFLGPNSPAANGSVTGVLEATAEFFTALVKKVLQEGVRSFSVRREAQAEFDIYTQEVMQNMVWTGSCSSWYKSPSGRITALWPGSSLHYRQILASRRWEDFTWQYHGNRYEYFGQGLAKVEKSSNESERDLAYYIEPANNLPLEAYYCASKGYEPDLTIPTTFLPGLDRSKEYVEVSSTTSECASEETRVTMYQANAFGV